MNEEQGQGLPPELRQRIQEANRIAEKHLAMTQGAVEIIHRIVSALDSEISKRFPQSQRLVEPGWGRGVNGAVLRIDPITETEVVVKHTYFKSAPESTSKLVYRELYVVRAYTTITVSTPTQSGLKHRPTSLWYWEGDGIAEWFALWFSSAEPSSIYVALNPEEATKVLEEKKYKFRQIDLVDEADFVNQTLAAFDKAASSMWVQ